MRSIDLTIDFLEEVSVNGERYSIFHAVGEKVRAYITFRGTDSSSPASEIIQEIQSKPYKLRSALLRMIGDQAFTRIWQVVDSIPGYLSEIEALTLYLGVKNRKPRHILELGTFCGRSTVLLGLTVKEFGLATSILAVDSFVKTSSDLWTDVSDPKKILLGLIEEHELQEIVTVKQSDSVEAITSLEAPTDFVFIDTDHTAELISQEIAALRGKIAPNGLLLIHDYQNRHVEPEYTAYLKQKFVGRMRTVTVVESDTRHTGNGLLYMEVEDSNVL